MPNTAPPADDDILELTDVVAPGNPLPKEAPKAQASPVGDPSLGADFGADLDALLDSLGAESQVAAPAPQSGQTPIPAPIADPTLADHTVDPNEELKLPELSDIDLLLQELGVSEAAAPAAAPAAPAPAKAQPVLDDLPDDLAAMISEAAPKAPPAEAKAVAAAPQPAAAQPVPDDLPDDLAAMISEAAPKAAPAITIAAAPPPKPASPSALDGLPDDLAAMINEAAPKAAPEPAPEPEAASGNDGIDLNELDALLDDMLATAPSPGPAPAENGAAAAPRPEPQAAPAPAMEPEPISAAPESAASGVMAAALAARLDALEKELEDLRTEREAALQAVPQAEPQPAQDAPDLDALLEEKLIPIAASSSETATRLDALEKDLGDLRAAQESAVQAAPQTEEDAPDLEALLEEKLAALTAPGSPLMETLAASVTERVLAAFAATEEQEDAPLRQALDKSAAAAAAKVIREEIAALLQE